MNINGLIYIGAYVLLVGSATFLQKFVMKELNPFQINFLMAMGMMIIASTMLYFNQHSFAIPKSGLMLGSVVGVLMPLGSIAYVFSLQKLAVGVASAISVSYVIVTLLLSIIILNENLNMLKLIGIGLTLAGVALLTYQMS